MGKKGKSGKRGAVPFPVVLLKGGKVRRYGAWCHFCGSGSATLVMSRGDSSFEKQRLARGRFVEAGWTVKGGAPVCPLCSNPERAARVRANSGMERDMASAEARAALRD